MATGEIDVAIGARIRLRRRLAGIRISDLAAVLGISLQQVQHYELGHHRIAIGVLMRIAAALDTTVAQLVGEGVAGAVTPEVAEQLATSGAPELLVAYAAIPAPFRSHLVAMTQAISEGAAPADLLGPAVD